MSLDNLILIFFARWRTIAITTVVALVIAGIITSLLPRTYTATTDLIIDIKDQDPISGQVQQPNRALASYVGTQAVIIQSPNVARKVIDELKLTSNAALAEQLHFNGDEASRRGKLMGFLDKGLSVTPTQNSSVFSIAFNARDPIIAAQLANTFAQIYMKTNLELRIEPAKQINQWYDEQLASLRETLIDKQNSLANYQEKHDIIASTDRLDLESNKLAELSSMLIAAQGERLNNTSRNDQIVSGRGGIPAQAMDNPLVQRLSGELAQAQAKLGDTATRVGENHPQYRQALSDVESIKAQLQQAVRSVSGSFKSSLELSLSREEQLTAELATQKERVLQLSRTRNELNLLKQEVDNAQTTYDQALGRSTKTKLESRIAQTDIALLNAAEVPSRPSSPRTSMNLMLALIAGLLFGSALALGQEWLDRRVRSASDLEHGLGLPVLAYLPTTVNIKPTRSTLLKGALS